MKRRDFLYCVGGNRDNSVSQARRFVRRRIGTPMELNLYP